MEYTYLKTKRDFNVLKEAFSEKMLVKIEDAINAYENGNLVVDLINDKVFRKDDKEVFKEAVYWHIGYILSAKFFPKYGDNLDYQLYKNVQGCFRGRDLDKIKELVGLGANVNYAFLPDDYKHTPLHWAAHNSDIAVMEYLLNQGADVNAVTKGGKTPLDVAISRHNDKNTVDFLVSHGGKRSNELANESLDSKVKEVKIRQESKLCFSNNHVIER